MSKQIEDILKKYGNDAKGIQTALYEYMKNRGIPYVRETDTAGVYEVFDGKKTLITTDKKVVDFVTKLREDGEKENNRQINDQFQDSM